MRARTYEITVRGQADDELRAEFDDCTVTLNPGSTTLLADLPDQSALSRVMDKITSLGLEVIHLSLVKRIPRQ